MLSNNELETTIRYLKYELASKYRYIDSLKDSGDIGLSRQEINKLENIIHKLEKQCHI